MSKAFYVNGPDGIMIEFNWKLLIFVRQIKSGKEHVDADDPSEHPHQVNVLNSITLFHQIDYLNHPGYFLLLFGWLYHIASTCLLSD